jgi:hypothetical protein
MNKSKKIVAATLVVTFFGWGAWAYFINLHVDDGAGALRAALVQASYSTIMTLYMSFSVLFIAQRTYYWPLRRFWPALGTVGHTGPILVFVHYLNHTPNILKTVSLPLAVAFAYCLVLGGTYSATDEAKKNSIR